MILERTQSGEAEAVVLVKAAPHAGARHGEAVCCAAIDLYGKWLRLYPISFRHLDDSKKFGRWDRIRFHWRLPDGDSRFESRRIDQDGLRIVGDLKRRDRGRFLSNLIVTSLDRELDKGRSLALLKAEILRFFHERKSQSEIDGEKAKFAALHAQADLFAAKALIPYRPSPYRFKYRYRIDDGDREGTCQDWETEATFHKWVERYGEEKALEDMVKCFGEEYPAKGMLLAMGTHSRRPRQWLINGVIRLDEVKQFSLL